MKIPRLETVLKKVSTPHPARDWAILLALGAAFSLVLLSVALYFFLGIQSGFIVHSSGNSRTPTPAVSREALEDTISLYETRLINYQEGNIETPSAADPAR